MAAGLSGAPWWRQEWGAPWWRPVRSAAQAVTGALEQGGAWPQVLEAVVAAPVRFVPQSCLPDGVAYESHVFDTGSVPTREGLHDFFNALVWVRFPLTKRLLNRLQATEIAAAGVGQVRGPVRDAITLFDENAALLQAPAPLWDALRARAWERLFVELRPLWAQARLVLFGHALMEKLVDPYKSITAHVYTQAVPMHLADDPCQWDAWLAAHLTPSTLASKPFTPLPVLGVPGWWPANADPAFYADTTVFRPARQTNPLVFPKHRTI